MTMNKTGHDEGMFLFYVHHPNIHNNLFANLC